MTRLIGCALLVLGLAACGDLPEPFLGNPGATGRRLAQPPTPRLVVPAPGNALLPDAASKVLADDLARSLQEQELPAVAQAAKPTEWRLDTTASTKGGSVVPVFTVLNPKGEEQGKAEGAPVPAEAWSAAEPTTLGQVATEAAPKIVALLSSIHVAMERADPNSLYNRAAKVMVADVTGAPGDGNEALTRHMRTRLGLLGPVIQTTSEGADFVVQGEVKAVPLPNNQERIEIQWVVKDATGDERGKVVQLNEIPAGTLDHFWGDVAVVVATEASNGIDEVIKRQTGHEQGAGTQGDTVRGQSPDRLVEGRTSNAERAVKQ
ncbi:MAG: hypothetical protein JO227_21270 [Acetobacteraceae bacterium]|nr:hypothetical protein [Acetobacteraceae bacterium]